MAKKKAVNEENYFAELAKATGGEVLEDVSKVLYYIDTGNLATNYICSGRFINGGIPGGKIVEAYGGEGSGKSLWGLRLIAAVQRMNGIGVLIDTEAAVNPYFARDIGQVDTRKTIVFAIPTYEQIDAKVRMIVNKIREKKGLEVPIFICWDSIAPTMCDREWREIKLPENYTQAQFRAIVKANEQPGERAKAAGKFFRKMVAFLSKNNATLYVTNQVREKIGVMFGDPETTAGGGRALAFYASTRLQMKLQKTIKDSQLKIPLGINLKVFTKKNRTYNPFMTAENIQLFFDSGINPLGGLLGVLIGSKRVVPAGKGVYQVNEPWSNGTEYKFKSSKERNDVPLSVILDCPKLIDAESREQVEEYIKYSMDSIELSNSSTTQEVSLDSGDEPSGFDFDEVMSQADED